jgi:hypothetical protein
MVAAEVPVPPSVMPLASVTNVKLTDALTVAVTAMVPEAVVANAGALMNPAQITSIPIPNIFSFIFKSPIRNLSDCSAHDLIASENFFIPRSQLSSDAHSHVTVIWYRCLYELT